MTLKHHIEQEIKLTATDKATLERLMNSPLVRLATRNPEDTPVPQSFAATYYDTPDWTLRDLRWSLRTRYEGEFHVCTLKRNSTMVQGFSSCEEIEQATATGFERVGCIPEGKIAEALCEILPPSTPLLPRVKVTMQRSIRVLDLSGTLLELVTDSGFISANGKQYELHEIELERLQGDIHSDAVSTFTKQLISSFSLQHSPMSKHQIGLSLYKKLA